MFWSKTHKSKASGTSDTAGSWRCSGLHPDEPQLLSPAGWLCFAGVGVRAGVGVPATRAARGQELVEDQGQECGTNVTVLTFSAPLCGHFHK